MAYVDSTMKDAKGWLLLKASVYDVSSAIQCFIGWIAQARDSSFVFFRIPLENSRLSTSRPKETLSLRPLANSSPVLHPRIPCTLFTATSPRSLTPDPQRDTPRVSDFVRVHLAKSEVFHSFLEHLMILYSKRNSYPRSDSVRQEQGILARSLCSPLPLQRDFEERLRIP